MKLALIAADPAAEYEKLAGKNCPAALFDLAEGEYAALAARVTAARIIFKGE